jgi:hypothetical protein
MGHPDRPQVRPAAGVLLHRVSRPPDCGLQRAELPAGLLTNLDEQLCQVA